MKYILRAIKDGLRGLKMMLFCGRRDRFGHIADNAIVCQPFFGSKQNIYMYENTIIQPFAKIVANKGRFVLKSNSRAAMGLTVVCENHSSYNKVGCFPGGPGWNELTAADVIVEEEVWLGINVTLSPGTHINRGCVVAAGSVCIKNKEYPPYSIIGGNPAKFLKFKFTLEEMLEHERLRFAEKDRIPEEILRANWEKFSVKK